MRFKDVVDADVQLAFLNSAEFAVEVEVDGVPVLAVVDDSGKEYASGVNADGLQNGAGLALEEHVRVLYAADCDFPVRPVPRQLMLVDGEDWRVSEDVGSVRVEQGMLVLRLVREYA